MTRLRLLISVTFTIAIPGLFDREPACADKVIFMSNFERDSDGDGIADGWAGAKGACSLIPGPHGKCAKVTVPAQGDFLDALDSQPVPVQSGERYRVRFRCAAERVHIFHVKLRWLSSSGETLVQQVGDWKKYYEQLTSPPKIFGETWWWDAGAWNEALPTGERNGSWDWETWEATCDAPSGAASVRVEFWAKCKGGEFLLDDVDIEEASAEHFKLRSLRTPRTSRSPQRPNAKQVISFAGPVEVTLRNDSDGFWGIGAVTIRGIPVRSRAMPLAPLFVGREPLSYQRCVLRNVERARDGKSAILHTELTSADGTRDQLDWLLRPERFSIAGVEAVGLSYSYRFRSSSREVHDLIDRSSWCLGGEVNDLREIEQSGYPQGGFPPVVDFTRSTVLNMPWGASRIGLGDFMDFLTAANLSLISFIDRPALSFKRLFRSPAAAEILAEERFVFPLSTEITTPRRMVLLYPRDGVNAWTAARDSISARLCREAGIEEADPLPIINVSQPFYSVRGTCADAITKALPLAKRLEFKWIYIGPPWVSAATEWGRLDEARKKQVEFGSSCAPFQLDVASAYGGVEGLRSLCEAADKEGIQVIAWLATSHLSDISPLFTEHPEWMIKQRDGTPFKFGYRDITGVYHPAGYGDYAVRKLRELRRASGLHGFWLDSYPTFGTDISNYADPRWSPQLEAIVHFQKELQQLGYVLLDEGHSPFGTPSCGFGGEQLTKYYAGSEWVLYRTSPYWDWWAKAAPPKGTYFRCLASKCTPLIMDDVWMKDETLDKEGKYTNVAYARLLPLMKQRTILPQDAGVLWKSGGAERAVFAFRSGWIDIEVPVAAAKDAVTGEPVIVNGARIRVTGLRAYRAAVRESGR